MVLTAYFVLAPETGLVVSVPSATRKRRHQVDISVGISGPHDFAVRDNTPRRECDQRPPLPDPTFVTTRTPLIPGYGIARVNKSASTKPRSEIFSFGDMDSRGKSPPVALVPRCAVRLQLRSRQGLQTPWTACHPPATISKVLTESDALSVCDSGAN